MLLLFNMSKGALSIIAIILAVGLVAALLRTEGSPGTITATGSATLSYEPDEALIGIYVVTTKDTAESSQKENARISDAVIASLKRSGAPTDTIETFIYTVYPEYSYASGERPTLLGYKATHGFRVTTSQLDNVGSLVDAASSAGANQFDSIQFRLSDARLEQVKAELLAAATQNARSKALAIANAAGVKLGKLKSLSESVSGIIPIYAEAKAISDLAQAPTPIQPGNVEISGDVTVVYEI